MEEVRSLRGSCSLSGLQLGKILYETRICHGGVVLYVSWEWGDYWSILLGLVCGSVFSVLLGFNGLYFARVVDLLFAWRNWFGKHCSSIWNLVPACLMWTIWRECNRCIFQDSECSENQILEKGVTTLYHWTRSWGYTSCSYVISFIASLDPHQKISSSL